MRQSVLLLPLCFVVAMLAGCGNKGPLTLPAKPAPAPAPAQSAAPAAAATVNAPADGQH
jgi:predicted small lipoprotein YifL